MTRTKKMVAAGLIMLLFSIAGAELMTAYGRSKIIIHLEMLRILSVYHREGSKGVVGTCNPPHPRKVAGVYVACLVHDLEYAGRVHKNLFIAVFWEGEDVNRKTVPPIDIKLISLSEEPLPGPKIEI